MALGCTWNGYANTGIAISEFYDNDFTIAIRFLRRYPNAYTGPMISNEEVPSPGTFVIAQGSFTSDKAKELGADRFPMLEGKLKGFGNILIDIGKEVRVLPLISDDNWHHLALVCKNGNMQAFVDGVPSGKPIPKPAKAPQGVLWLGRSTDGGRGNQFYGLLDDFAIFKTALSNNLVQDLSAASHLTGKESGLLVGHTFGFVPPGGLPATLTRSLKSVSPAASIVEVSPQRNGPIDLSKVPLPLNSHMRLPFPRGEEWRVSQGFNNPTVSHHGYAAFSWDFVSDSGGSEGEVFISCAPGKISNLHQSEPIGTKTSNFVTVEQAPVEFCDYLHLEQDSVPVKIGDKVGFGTALAQVGNTGTKGHHLHLAVTNIGEGEKDNDQAKLTFLTIPVAFSNYDVLTPDGDWKRVIRGIPEQGQVVRTPPEDGAILYNAVWVRSTQPEIQVYNWKFEDFHDKYEAIKEGGWRLKMLRVVTADNSPRYTAIWRQTGTKEKRVYNYKQTDLLEKHAELAKQGFNMRILTSFLDNGLLRYSAVWTPGNAEQELLLAKPRLLFEEEATRLKSEDARLESIATVSVMNVDVYSAVWTKGAKTEEVFAIGKTLAKFRETYDELWSDGWRLSRLAVCNPTGSPPLFSGFWRKNPGAEEIQVYRWNYEDVRARYDVLWELGWRLQCIEPYSR